MLWILRIVLIAACMAMSVCSYAQEDITPITGYVLTEPRIAEMSDGKYCVNYELVIANATSSSYTLEEIRVVNPARSDKSVRTLKADEIVRQIYIPGAEKPVSKILSGKSGYIKINLTFDSKDAIPEEVEHIITALADTPIPLVPQPAIERIGRSKVSSGPAVVIGPPLRGANWVAAVVGADGYHRNAVMPIGGTWVAPERWAVDWIQLDEGNRLLTGAIEKNESYPQYGKEIIAVADGLIESVQDGMPDIPAGKAPELKALDDAAGNSIVQDIGGGFYALYAHLQPGSLKVKKGDAVKKGQVVALLGNSGNTTGPHLHFHVIHGKSPLGSDGVPYVIDSFAVRGKALSGDGLQTELERGDVVTVKAATDDGSRTMTMPADLSVIDFKNVHAQEKSVIPTAAPHTLDNLLTAYTIDANANARYLAFAQKAKLEDFDAVSSLFKATAFAEQVHFQRYAKLIEKLGGVPKAVIETPIVKSTKENLEVAVEIETNEHKVMYAEFLKKAEEENAEEAIAVFRDAQAAEASHVLRYTKILENLEYLTGLKKDFFVCPVCGDVLDVLTVAKCPVCGASRKEFKKR